MGLWLSCRWDPQRLRNQAMVASTPSFSNEYCGKGHLFSTHGSLPHQDMKENIGEAERFGSCRENSKPSERGFNDTTLWAQGTCYTEIWLLPEKSKWHKERLAGVAMIAEGCNCTLSSGGILVPVLHAWSAWLGVWDRDWRTDRLEAAGTHWQREALVLNNVLQV